MTEAREERRITADGFRWPVGATVTKRRGSNWSGRVVGFYSTQLTPEGYAVESQHERGSVQIYPVAALVELSGDFDPKFTPEEEAELVDKINSNWYLQPPQPQADSGEIERLREHLIAITEHGVFRDSKWFGMTARDIARSALQGTQAKGRGERDE